MKKIFSTECPCGEKEFAIQYYLEKGELPPENYFCPFCGAEIETEVEDEEDEDLE